MKCNRCNREMRMWQNMQTGQQMASCDNCKYDMPIYSQPQQFHQPQQPRYICPRCGGINISFQREQTGSFGAGTNRVIIQEAKKSKGCLYWCLIGWWWKPIYWLCFGWWWGLFFGGRNKRGLNFNASKTINSTIAICQNCGNSWRI